MKRSKRQVGFTLARVIVGVGLAAFLLWKVVHGSDVDIGAEFAAASVPLLLLGLGVYGVVLLLSIIRWRLLLRVQGFHWRFFDLIKLSMIGQFFNMVVPGGVGGDVVKMAYVRHHAGPRTTEAVTTIMLDRVLGLFGLFVIAVIACFLNFQFLKDAEPSLQQTTIGIGLAAFGAICSTLCVIFRQRLQNLPLVKPTIAWGARALPARITQIISRIVAALDLYRDQHSAVFGAIGISAVLHALNGLILLVVCRAFGDAGVTLALTLLTIQVANTFASVPILPGGLGARDYIVKVFLQASGAATATTVVAPIFFTVIMLAWMLVGGLFFVFGRMAKDPDMVDTGDARELAKPAGPT